MKPPPWKTWVKLAVLLFVGIAMYALAGLLLAPRGVESQLRAMVEQQPGLRLELAAASVNPFTLGFSTANVIIIGPENTPLVSIERLDGHVHPASLIERRWIMRRVTVHGARADLQTGDDGFTAVFRLAGALLGWKADKSRSGAARIAHLAVHRGELQLRGIRIAGRPAPAFTLNDLELEVGDRGAVLRGSNPFELTATVNHRARLDARGEMRSGGETPSAELTFSVDDASAFNRHVGIGSGWAWSAGRLQGDAIAEFREGRIRISGDAELRELGLAGSDGGESVFNAAAVVGRGVVIDSSLPVPTIDTVRFRNGRLRLEREPAGELVTPPWLGPILDPANAQARIANIELADGSLAFTDRSVSPALTFELHEIDGRFTSPGRGGDVAAASLRGQATDTGRGEVTLQWLPERPLDFTRVEVSLQEFSLSAISPYVVQAIGRPVTGGFLDLTLHLSVADERLGLDNRLVVRNLHWGDAPLTLPTEQLPLELAAALLENDEGYITMDVHIPARRVASIFDPTVLLTNALADVVTEITANPFEHLAGLVGRPGVDLGRLAFPAGSPEVTDDTAAKLALLGAALSQRPGIGLIVYPGYDPVADRQALARQQVGLHVDLATSSGRPDQPGQATIDFADRKVHAVLDEFAENRLSASRREAISTRHVERNTAYYREVFEALVDNEDVTRTALDRLARYRAQAVVHGIVKSVDNDRRIRQADVIETVEPGDVSGAVTLAVETRSP